MRWPSTRVLLGVALGVLAVTAVGLGAWWWTEAQERQALTAYAEPLARLGAGRSLTPEARAAVAADLEAALARYPSASIAAQAAFELGNLRYAERDYARARSAWEVAATRAGSPTLRTLARAGIGDTWEAEGQAAKAVEAYQAALAPLRPGDFHYEELLLALGRAQELSGNRAAAVETYRRLVRERPQSPRADDARGRLLALGAAS